MADTKQSVHQDIDLIFTSVPFFMRAITTGHQEQGGPCTRSHFSALKILENHGGLSVSELAVRMNREKGSVSPIVQALEDAGYCNRRKDPSDRRVQHLYLTDEGRRVLEEHLRSLSDLMLRNMSSVSENDREEMRRALRTLRHIAERILGEDEG